MADAGDNAVPEFDTELPSSEVGSEGGSPGDVEFDRGKDVGGGSEAGQTGTPVDRDVHEVHRDETGIGRRTPSD